MVFFIVTCQRSRKQLCVVQLVYFHKKIFLGAKDWISRMNDEAQTNISAKVKKLILLEISKKNYSFAINFPL